MVSSSDQETESAEYRSFQRHYADLFETIWNPIPLAARLFSADLLPRHTRDRINEVTLREQKVSELLVATELTIRLDPSNYHKFVEALEKDSSMQHLCGKLRSTCAQFTSLHTPQLVSSLPPNRSAAQQTNDSMIPSSITSSNTTGIMTYVCVDEGILLHSNSLMRAANGPPRKAVGVVGIELGIYWMKPYGHLACLVVVPSPSRFSTYFWFSVKYGCLVLLCAAVFWCRGRLLRSAGNLGILLNPRLNLSFQTPHSSLFFPLL